MRTLLIVAISLCLVSASYAAEAVKSEPSIGPDVLVLVLSVLGPNDQVSINYSTSIPDDQAKADLAALVHEAGWTAQNVQFSTKSVGTPGAKPTTSIIFQTIRVANVTEGLLPLTPFVSTLKRFKTIEINYMMTPDFKFRGLKDFEDKDVKVLLNQYGNSYRYRVQVKNSNADRIQIPLKPVPKQRASAGGGLPVWARMMLILGAAIVGAVLVYMATLYISKQRASR